MKLILGIAVLFIFSCQHKISNQHLPVKTVEVKNTSDKSVETKAEVMPEVKQEAKVESKTEAMASDTLPVQKSTPNFGILFSGGGARAWAHVGVLKEMQKYKFPVVAVAGIEWGAVIGAVYAQNLSANEVEWEMSKFKSLDKTNEFLKTIFAKKTTADMKTAFTCPSLNLKSQSVYLLNRGNVDQFLPFCVPSAGLAKPYGQSVALMSDVSILAQQLKIAGAQKIILINVLGSKKSKPYLKSIESVENQIWVESATQLTKKNTGIDEVIEINFEDLGIEDFDSRREMMAKGSELSYTQIKKIADKFGL